ncbi:MAG: DUF3253 domain-containing protein [Pseudomonadota bacterium]
MSEGLTPEQAILDLLVRRGPGKTICPSEAARLIAGPDGDWRSEMGAIHAATDALLDADDIRLSWKDTPKEKRRGPYRIARR